MELSTLSTKLFSPKLRTNLIFREKLFGIMDKGINKRLTIVCAPAGYGKTTLLSTWLSRSKFPFAWISLDDKDNNLYRFFTYVVTALRRIEPEGLVDTWNLLQASRAQPYEVILSQFVNEIAVFPQQSILVFDDYHCITSQDIHEAMTFILDNHIPNLHIVISSRFSTPFSVSNLRAKDQLVEIHQEDIKFSKAEVSMYLDVTHHIELNSDDLDRLESSTEGWIAGVQLFALSIKEGRNASETLDNLTGDNKYFIAFFMDVVFSQQPKPIQSFLLQTSILEQLNASLCDLVTGNYNGREILEYLEKSHLFITALDEKNQWYRYHHLFSDMLKARLKQLDPSGYGELLNRASLWYEKQGQIELAINYSFLANDLIRASTLLEHFGIKHIFRGVWYLSNDWLQKLPPDLLSIRPKLWYMNFWTLVNLGKIQEARHSLNQQNLTKFETIDPKESRLWKGNLLICKSVIAIHSDYDLQKGRDFAAEGLKLIPQDINEFYEIANGHYSHACLLTGHIQEARTAINGLLERPGTYNTPHIVFMARMHLAEILVHEGFLKEALEQYTATHHYAELNNLCSILMCSKLKIGMSDIYYEWNDLDQASVLILEGIRIAERYGDEDFVVLLLAYSRLLNLQLILREHEGAQKTLRRMEMITRRAPGSQYLNQNVATAKIQFSLCEGNLAAAHKEAEELASQIRDPVPYSQENCALALAQVNLIAQRYEDAIRILEKVQKNIIRQGRDGDLIRVRIKLAKAYYLRDNLEIALEYIKEAVWVALKGNYIRSFIDEGEEILYLLIQLSQLPEFSSLNGTRTVEHLNLLIKSIYQDMQRDADKTYSGLVSNTFADMTEREIEVLRFVAKGLSNQQIADNLVVTLSTIKWHLNNIYIKLGVSRRTHAVRLAKELKII